MDKMTQDTLFSSDSDEWATPPELFAGLDAEFHFDLDPCATADNAKCTRFYTVADDGLAQPWHGTVFVNPPYSHAGHWMAKAWQESRAGAIVVCLVASRTDTAWWHDYAMLAHEVRFIRGRLRFVGAKNSAPFPSAIVVFRPGDPERLQVSAIDRTGSPVTPAPGLQLGLVELGNSAAAEIDEVCSLSDEPGNGGVALPAGVPRGAHIEEKMINNCGPYRYARWREGGRLRSRYLGKVRE